MSQNTLKVHDLNEDAEFDENGSSHSWFVGYSNVDDPDLVVAIIVENGGTGSESAVPIAGQLFDAYYYD